MTRSLPIYKPSQTVLDGVEGLLPDKDCSRCGHSAGPGKACLPWEGEVGGLLVVDSYPTRSESASRRHLMGTLGAKLRQMAQSAGMPIAYTTALRCPPKAAIVGEGAAALVPSIDQCRPYLVRTLEEVKPQKIIALGAPAIYALTGASVIPSTTRKGFAWLHLEHGWVPVFYGISPALASRNKFLTAWLEEDFSAACINEAPTEPPVPGETWAHLVITPEDAALALKAVACSRWTAVDCEWAGRPYDRDFKLLSLAMTPAPHIYRDGMPPDLTDGAANEAWVWTQDALRNPQVRSLLAGWLRDPKHKKVGSYFKADTVALHAALGVWPRGVTFDTRLLRRLMDAEASGKLADMAHLVGRGGHKDELDEAMKEAVSLYKRQAAKGSGGLFRVPLPGLAEQSHADKILAGAEVKTYGFAFVEPEQLYRYNAADTVVTSLVGGLLEYWLSQEPAGMQHVAREVVGPAGDAYARIESWGLRVDRDALQNVGTYLDMQTESLVERLRPYGYDPSSPDTSEFNPSSPQKIGKLLFDTLKLKSDRLTDKGAQATDEEALEALKDQHPVVADILSWRGLTKMRATYVDAMLGFIRDDGRVHPSIHPDGARTGRTSSSHPNMQTTPSVESNDPLRAEMARMYRSCFAPPEGYSLLEVDYSQLELRVAADLSGDPAMLEIFHKGLDFHMQTARLLSKTLWNIEPDTVTDTHRREVKPYAFALLYDDSPHGIAFRIGVTVEKAEQIKAAVFGCFPLLAKWIKERVRETASTGYAWTWWAGQPARRRPLIEVADPESKSGRTARRGSWNGPIQGTGNEYLVASAIQVVDWLVSEGIPAKLLVTIHDSMLLEVRDDCMSEVCARVLEIMGSHQTKNGVPLVADAKAGKTWASMMKWKKGAPCPVEGCT